MLNVSRIDTGNYVNGVGKRFVLWVQGCQFHCSGCGNPDSWSFETGQLLSVDSVFDMIQKSSNLDGVTFSGGEPFLQALDLAKLSKKIKENTNLTIQCFTGFELSELCSDEQLNFLKYLDTLVYGRYDASKINANQKIWQNPIGNGGGTFENKKVEIDLDSNGTLEISGFPSKDLLLSLENME